MYGQQAGLGESALLLDDLYGLGISSPGMLPKKANSVSGSASSPRISALSLESNFVFYFSCDI